ncbi:MAG: NADH-quinone oxidoreductase subunit F [Chloroflexota bacterium]|nr:MAG: NADH-quinone oxidoreductase subunit F [Chloroflexota bacterium]
MNEVWVTPSDLASRVAAEVEAGASLLTLVGADERATDGGFATRVVLDAGGVTRTIASRLDGTSPRYPSIAALVPAVHWDEREQRDLLGIVPEDHPDPRGLVLRAEWPDGLYPLRKDFDPSRVPAMPRHDTFAARTVAGEDVVEIPVGPIHAGIIEPGHFRFSAVGETILHLDAQLFYTHRGLEKVAEGRPLDSALVVAERACGACTVSHAGAFSIAAEQALGIDVPPRAEWGRALLFELERLYNHLGDAGNMCAGGGFALGTMAGARMKEAVQRRLDALVGHRFGRGAIAVGGLRRDLPSDTLTDLWRDIRIWRSDLRDFRDLVLTANGIVDRMTRTGVLTRDAVIGLGAVGVAARASGVDRDVRRDRPYGAYGSLPVRVPTQTEGDTLARFRQRLDEALTSFDLIETLLESPPTGLYRNAVPSNSGQPRTGIGVVESPRGLLTHWLRIDASGKIDRLRIRSASFANWPLVSLTAPGNLVPDFPLINKSFELCYACTDR